MKVLVLGGTGEARALSQELGPRPDIDLVVSLAGLTSEVADHGGRLRSGGFGGVDGLVRHLRDEHVDVVVDATHPFAATMPTNAAVACERAGIPRLRLLRPSWQPEPGDRWTDVADLDAAARAVERSGAGRVLLTTGRLGLEAFAGIDGVAFVVRTIESPDPGVLPGAELVRGRGPFTVGDELTFLRDRRIDLAVTKNSGGNDAKLVAARALRLPVVVVARPEPVGGPTATTVPGALDWLSALSLH